MTSRRQVAAVTLAAAAGLFAAGGTAVAAAQQDDMKARHGETKRHESMAARHPDVAARLAALDSRIQLLTQQMNSFVGDARIDAMAALLAAVVEQNQTMRSAMAEMKGGMTTMMESCPMHGQPAPSAAPSHDHTESQK